MALPAARANTLGKNMLELQPQIDRFFRDVAEGLIDIYNEFSLQHELGIFLRRSFPTCKVQFERPVSSFIGNGAVAKGFVKKEIDLVISPLQPLDPPEKELFAIELKYPRNGQYPEQMFKFCEDIRFLEQLVAARFDMAFFICVADDHNFYRGDHPSPIYPFFRSGVPLRGSICKPTGAKDKTLELQGVYQVQWMDIRPPLKYVCVPIGHS
jgi:hypothetical protein